MVWVIRLGHRKIRDQRATTHAALVARAFGAEGMTIFGDDDGAIGNVVGKICEEWGGKFLVEFGKGWLDELKRRKENGETIVHLTMYGEKIEERIGEIRKKEKCAVVIGSQKVPAEVYQLADFNVSVTTQPHSEIAALAIFLDRYFEGAELGREFGGKRAILPSKFGKNVFLCKKHGQI